MASYRLVIAEDDPAFADRLEEMLAKSPHAGEFDVTRCGTLSEVEALLVRGESPDVLLMDIVFAGDDRNGIEIVAQYLPYKGPTQVIYVSAFVEYCVGVYDTCHVGFLPKPIKQEDFDKAIDRAVGNVVNASRRPLVVTYNGETTVVPVHKIRYIESDLRIMKIHVGDEVVLTYSSLKELMDRLPDKFVQCHKGCLVNLDWVDAVTREGVVLRTKEVLPLSVRRRTPFQQALVKYLGSL